MKKYKIVPAKSNRFMMRTTGFPDFVAYRFDKINYQIIFVECKSNGYLSKEEKEKAEWYLKNKICTEFYISQKDPDTGKVKLVKLSKFYNDYNNNNLYKR
jgi:hypothetical protein